MLRSFRVANHKSFRDEAELLLMPAYDKTRPVVPVAAIFGANASGKSNLLGALAFMHSAVRYSYSMWEPGRGIPRSPFRLSRSAADEPSSYVIEIVVDDVRYVYGFAADDRRVREEWLYAYPHGRKRILFEREDDGGWRFGTSVPRSEVEVLRQLTRDNALFLSAAAHAGLKPLLPVYHWFQNDLAFHVPGAALRPREVASWLERSAEHRAKLVMLLEAADLGITDIRRRRVELPVADVDVTEESRQRYLQLYRTSPAQTEQLMEQQLSEPGTTTEREALTMDELVFVHGPEATELSEYDQSRGTLAWLELLMLALTALEQGSLLCVDEIDASVHPRLTARLIELFHDREANPRSAQLVFTTHDATLLGTSFGEDILRRDEIWFVVKGRDGATTLYPLSDFHPRKEENTERRYMGGSYGAVPLVSSADFRRALGLDPWVDLEDAAA